MRQHVAFLAALGFGASAGCQTSPTAAVLVMPPQGVGCPVGLSARRHAAGVMAFAGSQENVAGRQTLLVGLEQRGTSQLVSAIAKLYGVSRGTHAVTLGAAVSSEASESVTLEPQHGEQSLRRAVLEPRHLQGVSWMELTEVKFADGTTWHATGDARCIAEPSGVVLVDSK